MTRAEFDHLEAATWRYKARAASLRIVRRDVAGQLRHVKRRLRLREMARADAIKKIERAIAEGYAALRARS